MEQGLSATAVVRATGHGPEVLQEKAQTLGLFAVFCLHKKNLVKWNREQKDRGPRWELRVGTA